MAVTDSKSFVGFTVINTIVLAAYTTSRTDLNLDSEPEGDGKGELVVLWTLAISASGWPGSH